MIQKMIRCPAIIYRGGTSKAIFLKENDLPADPVLRDRLVSAVFGSPDKRQIDGLGGADPLTSKLAIIGPPSRPDADVDYTFGQVDILSSQISYDSVCGNISSAVGPYAIEEGFVRPVEPVTKVRIHSKNIGRIIEAYVQVQDKEVQVNGDYAIDGVPGTGAKIELNWADTVGASTGSVLPTGRPQDSIAIKGGGDISVSIVDVGNPAVFVKAEDLQLKGTESPEDVDGNSELIRRCESIARAAAEKIGKRTVLMAFVAPPKDYVDHVAGKQIKAEQIDFLIRMIFMGKMHKALSASLTTCGGAASKIPGTVVNEAARPWKPGQIGLVRMGHPAGTVNLEIAVEEKDGKISFPKICVFRTARRLMEGYIFVKPEVVLNGSS
jgi:hypothetical protein